jgi:hypothetical protein
MIKVEEDYFGGIPTRSSEGGLYQPRLRRVGKSNKRNLVAIFQVTDSVD